MLSLVRRFDGDLKVEFFDFVIDGTSLYKTCNAQGLLGSFPVCEKSSSKEKCKKFVEKNLKLFLKPGKERVIFFGCCECFDVHCGALTARIVKNKSEFKWLNFAFEYGFSKEMQRETNNYNCEYPFSFTFNCVQYAEEFEKVLKN